MSSLQRRIEHDIPEYLTFLAHLRTPDVDSPPAENERPFQSSAEFCRLQKNFRDWVCKHVHIIMRAFPPNNSRCPASTMEQDREDFSIYVGVGGNAYLHWKLIRFYEAEGQKEKVEEHKEYAISAIEVALKILPSKPREGRGISFYEGNAGIFSLAAVIYWKAGHLSKTEACICKLLELLPSCLSPKAVDEILYGRAGYLYSLLFVKKHVGKEAVGRLGLDKAAKEVFEVLITEGKRNNGGSDPDKGILEYTYREKDYVGAAHGTAGILYVLLQFPDWCQDPSHKPWMVNTIDFILSLQSEDGNFPARVTDPKYHRYHWCHGAPGITYMLHHAHSVMGVDKSILRSLDLALKGVWENGLLKKGFGVCHGIAGSGYSFLMMHKYTRAEEYLYAAYKFAETIEKDEVKSEVATFVDPQRFKVGVPNFPYSLMEGLAGTICFFCDLLHPQMAACPGYDGDIQ